MSFINTKDGKLTVGEEYQYQGDRISDFGEKLIQQVVLVKDSSTNERHVLRFKDIEDGKEFDVDMLKGNFYFSGMPRIWDKDEYI